MSHLDQFLEESRRDFRAKLNKLVNDQLAQLNLSDAELAKKAGVDREVVESVLNESRDLTQDELKKISKALELRWE